MLIESYDNATEKGQISAAIRAAELLGKNLGLFTDRLEVRSNPLDELSFEDLERLIEALDAESAGRASNAGESGDTDSSEPAWLPPPS
jgi:hypothetical protein